MTDENKKYKILIVDDDERNLKLMGAILTKHGYSFETAKNGFETLEKVKAVHPDLIFLDIMMPEMDGYEACRRLKNNFQTEHIPVVMVTALEDRNSRLEALNAGANDFLTKPIESMELMVRAKNLLRVKGYSDFLKKHNEILDCQVEIRTTQLKESYIDTVLRLTRTAEYKDLETANHIKRSGYYATVIARDFGWPADKTENIVYAAPMHDIGKIGIPSEILLKPTRLSPEEFELMKTHTIIGQNILSGSVSNILQMAELIAVSHHERWDGTGYPKCLKHESIPIEGRIYNICDQYDAIRSKRPYKPAIEHKETVKIITEGDDRVKPWHFDPQVLEAFKHSADEFDKIFNRHQD